MIAPLSSFLTKVDRFCVTDTHAPSHLCFVHRSMRLCECVPNQKLAPARPCAISLLPFPVHQYWITLVSFFSCSSSFYFFLCLIRVDREGKGDGERGVFAAPRTEWPDTSLALCLSVQCRYRVYPVSPNQIRHSSSGAYFLFFFVCVLTVTLLLFVQFERLCALIESPEYTDDDRLVIMCPPVEQIRLELQPSTDQP